MLNVRTSMHRNYTNPSRSRSPELSSGVSASNLVFPSAQTEIVKTHNDKANCRLRGLTPFPARRDLLSVDGIPFADRVDAALHQGLREVNEDGAELSFILEGLSTEQDLVDGFRIHTIGYKGGSSFCPWPKTAPARDTR